MAMLCFADKSHLHPSTTVPGFNDARLDAGCIRPQAQADARFSQSIIKITSTQKPQHLQNATCFMLGHGALAALDTSSGRLQTITIPDGSVHLCAMPGFMPSTGYIAVSIRQDHVLLLGITPPAGQPPTFLACQSLKFRNFKSAEAVCWRFQNTPSRPIASPTVAMLGLDQFLVISGKHADETCSGTAYLLEVNLADKALQWKPLKVRAACCFTACDTLVMVSA